ncbi:MAG: DUF72 domain-containing protein [Bacteroidota bacterium]
MKFGKLHDISQVNFDLPPDPESTQAVLQDIPKGGQSTLYIGCTGWSMKEWVGHVYPKTAKTKDYLKHYTQQFNTIELNTTHYRIPNFETVQKWKTGSAADFKFCPKIPQSISHSSGMGLNDGKLIAFCEAIQQLDEKMGCCFMQLPPYFGVDRLNILKSFLDKFPNHIPLAVEVRHESWFTSTQNTLQLADLLASKRMAFVITDVAGRRDVLHQRITNNITMIRFVGNGLHPTDYSRIDDWLLKLKDWFAQGISEAYVFTHEPDNILSPEIAKYMVDQAKIIIPNIITRGPAFIKEQGQQMSLF